MKIFEWLPGKTNAWKIFFAGIPLVLVCWFGYGLLRLDRPVATWGVFGDKFGALNTLFTGFALVGLLATLVHQHDEIKSSKEDIEKVLEALVGTTEALSNQNQIAQMQAYHTTLIARIEGYTRQQAIYAKAGKPPGKLVKEQDHLYWELAKALEIARKAAGAEANIHTE